MTVKTGRTVLDDVADEAPQLVPAVASVMPFLDLFSEEGGIFHDPNTGESFYDLESDSPLPDEDGRLPDMHWSAGVYEDRVTLLRLQKCGSVSRILGRQDMSLEEFVGFLHRYGAKRSA